MIDGIGIDEFQKLRNNPQLAGLTDQQIMDLIHSEAAVVDEGMQTFTMDEINARNTPQAPMPELNAYGGQEVYNQYEENSFDVGKTLNNIEKGVDIATKTSSLLGTGGLKSIIAGAKSAIGGSAGLAGLAPLAPLAVGAGLLMYGKHRRKKKKEAREAKEEAQYKSRKLEQKQDLIEANMDYMEMASKYSNTYNVS